MFTNRIGGVGVAVVASLLAFGCEEESGRPNDDPLVRLADDVEDARAVQVEAACGACTEEGGPPAECGDPEPLDGCYLDALRIDSIASEDHLDCVLEAERTYADCMSAPQGCLDEATWSGCWDAYEASTSDCAELPQDVSAAVEGCYDAS